MRIINKDTDYAIAALCYVAKGQGEAIPTSEVASELEISYPFLRKIFHRLQKGGIVLSQKGKGGGYTLARSAGDIVVSDVMEVFQGPVTVGNCLAGKNACQSIKGCVLRKKLQTVKTNMVSELRELTIESLINDQ